MLIFWEQRLVFLATPKAGSTAVESALESLASAAIQRPAALKHADIANFHRHLHPWLEAQAGGPFCTVALMREPVDWLRSWYRFKLRDDHVDPTHRMEGVSFAQFASDYARPGGPAQLEIGQQRDFLTDGTRRVDRIFRYEDFPAFIEFLEDRLGCALEMPRINVPPPVDVHLDADQEARLREAMRADIDLYQSI
ncbi:hypothetical protein [Paracoccus siganidrum]|uniref:Sulfotransferase family protein n=1 Tax=Paracoccus siganidrum TaxID=1276757 RepID=A0A418ZXH6_9RHOB|nr:hypothetical protein [Paracoccus siganidrum]RJL05211.1 hypothetical protein D3P05_20000 [Paracoccus siganidrum]RMC29775.1 hypothetical protein C9E82_19775 [Paracoccus siganidrum]